MAAVVMQEGGLNGDADFVFNVATDLGDFGATLVAKLCGLGIGAVLAGDVAARVRIVVRLQAVTVFPVLTSTLHHVVAS